MIAIDLGSNTIRVLEFNCETKERVKTFEKIVKTADGLTETGVIADETIQRIIDAISEAKEVIDFNQPLKAITTEAIRQAKNSDEVIKKIKDKTDVEFEIIDGELEAFYTAKAIENVLKSKFSYTKDFMFLDIGGASTEIGFKIRDAVISQSYPFGIVTITQKYSDVEYGIKKEVKKMKEFLDVGFNRFKVPEKFVASSGTPTTIAALKIGLNYETYDYEKVTGVELNLKDLEYWLEKLSKMEPKEREKMVGKGRRTLILSGILIFKEILELTGYREVMVSDDGLREGVAVLECENMIS